MDNNGGNISAGFDTLLEQIDLEIQHVNKAGAEAFVAGQYGQVDRARQRVTNLREFRAKVLALRKEWEKPAATRRVKAQIVTDQGRRGISEPLAASDDQAARPQRRSHSRVATGLRTSEHAYYRPILEAIVSFGGAASVRDILDCVEKAMSAALTAYDYEPLPSDPNTLRWQNVTRWARNSMVNEGLLKSGSPHGIWEITEQGRQYLSQPPSPTVEYKDVLTERRNYGRVRGGLRTKDQAYYRPILTTLVYLGGSAEMNDLLERVERSMRPILTPVDYEPLPSQPNNPRWRNTAQWARNSMVNEGLLKSGSPRGIWEITQKGRDAIANLPLLELSSDVAPSEPSSTTHEPAALSQDGDKSTTDIYPTPATHTQEIPNEAELTPLPAFYRPILRALVHLGGSARLADVRAQVESVMKSSFSAADFSRHPDNPKLPFWLSSYYRAAGTLFHQGMITNGPIDDSWQITDKGRQFLTQEDNS